MKTFILGSDIFLLILYSSIWGMYFCPNEIIYYTFQALCIAGIFGAILEVLATIKKLPNMVNLAQVAKGIGMIAIIMNMVRIAA